jgi:hypothetical protein
MNCDDRQILMEQLLDGELPPTESSALERHLQDCPSCQLYFEQTQSEHAFYRTCQAQRSTLDLAPRLWGNIEQQLSASGRTASPKARWLEIFGRLWISPRMTPLAVAVLLVISISLTALYVRRQTAPDQRTMDMAKRGSIPSARVEIPAQNTPVVQKETPPEALSRAKSASATAVPTTAQTARKGTPPRKGLSPRELVRRAEENYQAAIALLERDFKRRPIPLDDSTRQQFQLALTAIDKNIEEMRKAVRRYPDDPQAIQYMLTAYAKKVDLLEEMVSY